MSIVHLKNLTGSIKFLRNLRVNLGYLCNKSSEIKPGIILLQEWWGLNDQMKRMAHRFSDAGFCVIVPDLYHGKGL